jgi:hypothetical protein
MVMAIIGRFTGKKEEKALTFKKIDETEWREKGRPAPSLQFKPVDSGEGKNDPPDR